MVSTRLMSSVGTSEGTGSSSGGAEMAAVRVTRHSSAAPGGSSPHAHASTSRCSALLPPHKPFSTTLLDLPIEVLEKIFHNVGYKSVSQMRLVNRQFNTICSSVLNSTFQRLQNQMLHRFQAIKAKMPRRESARRNHPLACESDIIETLHMRLSLLQMTFGKHIERKHCCFFPGEILDEVYGILAYLKITVKLARPYKVTDELFDLTTMAMEYFKEHIEPNLPEITYFGTDFFDITTAFSPGESSKSYMCLDSPPAFDSAAGAGGGAGGPGAESRRDSVSYLEESLPPSPPPPQSNMVLRKRIHRIKQGMKKYNDQLSALRSDLRGCKRKTALQQKQIAEQQKQIAEQQKQTLEYANRLDDYDKKNEETSRKFQTLLQELNKCKTELQYWRSRSPAVPPLCAECGAALPAAKLMWLSGEEGADAAGAEPAPHAAAAAAALATQLVEPAAPAATLPAKLAPKSERGESSGTRGFAGPSGTTSGKGSAGPSGTTSGKGSVGPSGSTSGKGSAGPSGAIVTKERSESSGEEGGSPAARRRADDATPERKKRRLTRPRKL